MHVLAVLCVLGRAYHEEDGQDERHACFAQQEVRSCHSHQACSPHTLTWFRQACAQGVLSGPLLQV